jgi:hypothetical protein
MRDLSFRIDLLEEARGGIALLRSPVSVGTVGNDILSHFSC